jgi:hypothetical protein
MGYRRCAKAEEWQTRRSSNSSSNGYEDAAAPPGTDHRDDETDPHSPSDETHPAAGATGHARHRAPSARAARAKAKDNGAAVAAGAAGKQRSAETTAGTATESVSNEPPRGTPKASSPNTQRASAKVANASVANTKVANARVAKTRVTKTRVTNTKVANAKLATAKPSKAKAANVEPARRDQAKTDQANTDRAKTDQVSTPPLNTTAPRPADVSENDSFAYDSMPVSLDMRRAHNSARDDRAATRAARNRLAWSELTLGDLALNDLAFTKQNSPARPQPDAEGRLGSLHELNADAAADGQNADGQNADGQNADGQNALSEGTEADVRDEHGTRDEDAAAPRQAEPAKSDYASGSADLFDRTFRGAAIEAGLKPESLGRHVPTFRRAIGSGQAVLLVVRCSRPDQPNAADHVLVVSRDRLVVTSETRSLHRVKPHLNAATAALLNVRWQVDPALTSIEFAATVIDGVRERFLISVKDPAAVAHIEAALGYVFRPAGIRRFNPVDPIMPSWMNPAGAY